MDVKIEHLITGNFNFDNPAISSSAIFLGRTPAPDFWFRL